MKTSKIDRLVSVVVIGICLVKAILYGGSKPPVSTNTPPSDIEGDPAPTNDPPPLLMMARPRLASPSYASQPPEPTNQLTNQLTNQIANWTARGAWNDWQRIDFPDGFAFPYGTNLLTGVTLMAWGEIRESLVGPLVCSLVGLGDTQSTNSLTNQQTSKLTLSLEPGVSTCVYGLTASNSFVFAWQDCCVEREATNRVNASIELFRNGSIAITTQPTGGSQPPTTNYHPPAPPPGFVGEGQDTNWLASTFSPEDYAAIENKGYARWLDEDFVGCNEENGHCRCTVSVHSLPPNGERCYLVCGSYKVIVTEPGDYDFPIDVLTDYHIRTYPTDVPVSFTYDEGYYPDEDVYGPLMSPSNQSNNPRLLGAPPPTSICARVIPAVHLAPRAIEFAETMNRHVTIWCNMAQAAWEYVTLGEDVARLNFINRHEVEVRDWLTLKSASYLIRDQGHPEVFGQLDLLRSYLYPDPMPTNGTYECHSDTNGTYGGSSSTNGTQNAGEP